MFFIIAIITGHLRVNCDEKLMKSDYIRIRIMSFL
jgi:hypothetical protein